MLLSKSNIAFFLYEKGLIDFDTYYLRNYTVSEIQARNLGVIFLAKNRKKIFVKQLRNNDIASKEIFEKEVEFYKRAFTKSKLCVLNEFIPQFIYHCEWHNVLIIEYVGSKKTKIAYKSVLGQLAIVLKKLHDIKINPYSSSQKPWIFQINDQASMTIFRNYGNYTHKIIKTISQNDYLIDKILMLEKEWKNTSLIHRDLKFDNIIQHKSKVFLIDWESVSVGDPMWDVACIIQSIIFRDIFSRNHFIIYGLSSSHTIVGNQKLEEIIQKFCYGYSAILSLENKVKIIKFTGCAMLKALIEMTEKKELDLYVEEIIYLSNEMLSNPEKYLEIF